MSESATSDDYYKKCQEFIKQDNFLKNIQDPESVQKKIQSIQNKLSTFNQQIPYILDEYKKYYVFLHKNPEYPDYQQMFANAQANLAKIGSEFFTIMNQIDVDNDLLNKKLTCLNGLIVIEKRKNNFLKRRLGIIENKSNASSELIYDYREIYNEGYLRNWALIISTIIVGFAIKNIYSNANGDITSNLKNMTGNVTNMSSSIYNNMKNIGNNMSSNVKNMGSKS
jgi:hypothetical protein